MARRKQAEALNAFKLNKGEQAAEQAQQSRVQKARSEVTRARELVNRYRKMLRNVGRQAKRARVSQRFMRDEKKRLDAIILELQQGMKCATRASEELTSPIKVEAAELRSKVEMLEGELRELKDRLRASETLAQQLAERSQRREVRVQELTQRHNATRERLQREKRSKTRKINEAKHRIVYLKEKGILTKRARTMCRKLAGYGVPADKMNKVIRAVCLAFHINIADNISPRTVLRVVVEGGIAAHLQIFDEMIQAGGKLNLVITRNRFTDALW